MDTRMQKHRELCWKNPELKFALIKALSAKDMPRLEALLKMGLVPGDELMFLASGAGDTKAVTLLLKYGVTSILEDPRGSQYVLLAAYNAPLALWQMIRHAKGTCLKAWFLTLELGLTQAQKRAILVLVGDNRREVSKFVFASLGTNIEYVTSSHTVRYALTKMLDSPNIK